MRQLPLLTVVALVVTILAWNLSFYGELLRTRPAQRPVHAEERAPRLHALSPDRVDAGAGAQVDDSALVEAEGAALGARARVLDEAHEPVVETIEHRYVTGAVKSEGALVDGRRHGTWTEYWEGGAVLMTGRYERGQRTGEWTFQHEDGTLRSRGAYRDGLRDGPWRSYHPGGQVLRAEGRHAAEEGGERVGLWTQYFTNGAIKEHGTYVRGVMEGDWIFYDIDGREGRRSGLYRSGDRVGD